MVDEVTKRDSQARKDIFKYLDILKEPRADPRLIVWAVEQICGMINESLGLTFSKTLSNNIIDQFDTNPSASMYA